MVGDGMITYKALAFVAYAVTNMKKARKFYEGVLGLKPTRVFSKNFIEYDIGAGTLVVACAPTLWKPSRHGTTATLEVKDFDAALAHLQKHKIPMAVGPVDFPACRMLAIRDPDGNKIALHQLKRAPRKKKKR